MQLLLVATNNPYLPSSSVMITRAGVLSGISMASFPPPSSTRKYSSSSTSRSFSRLICMQGLLLSGSLLKRGLTTFIKKSSGAVIRDMNE